MYLRYSLCTLVFIALGYTKANVYGIDNFEAVVKENPAYYYSSNLNIQYVHDPILYNESWHTLPQVLFWSEIIEMPKDSCILNVASTRQILGKTGYKTWINKTETEKKVYKDSLIGQFNLPQETSIYVTSGKKEFYNYKKEIPSISKAVKTFSNEGVNPWYAQAILLIESPGNLQKSSVGAYGSFQLMKSVGKKYGLIINKKVDERANFEKSAVAASKLIRLVCIPQIKKILDNKCIGYNESELWFRLLVLHAYHAGAGNVSAVINKINPTEGGISLITNMWQTEAGGFKNASQNYSQIALASLVRFDKMIEMEENSICASEGNNK